MNTNSKNLRYQLKQLRMKGSSLMIAFAAFGCAFLVETEQVDVTYPLELVLKSFTNDPISFRICSERLITTDPIILTISTK
ncbi:hypothetical protein ACFS7Z_17930 [Pontibacter toksunensis]|uniref:Uncharacterized protein n=1 Tax=Pontibacter toksunensis TaxID=1332631 RepID=A0ABW6BYJ5_9BACT